MKKIIMMAIAICLLASPTVVHAKNSILTLNVGTNIIL
jgi:hypothetical protein